MSFAHESQTFIQAYGPHIGCDDAEFDTVHVQLVKSVRDDCGGYFLAEALAPSGRVANQDAKLAGAHTMVNLIKSGMAQTRIGFSVGNRPDKVVGGLAALFDPFFDGLETIPRTKPAESARHLRIVAEPVQIRRIFRF